MSHKTLDLVTSLQLSKSALVVTGGQGFFDSSSNIIFNVFYVVFIFNRFNRVDSALQ